MFDEVCLSSGLHYNSTTDQVDGFVENDTTRCQEYADHALVFMVRGIKKKYKQPVAYTFCQGATKQHELACQLKEVRMTITSVFYVKYLFENKLFLKGY